MNIELEKSLDLPVSAALGWGLVENIEGIASCVPGAKITERLSDTRYKGTITVKLGPATVSFKGEIEVTELDPAARRIRVVGKGSDTSGASGASLDLTATVTETGPESCTLAGKSAVTVTGKVAAFGARLMGAVSDQLVRIFFAELGRRAEAAKAEAAAQAPAAETAPAADTAAEPILAETATAPPAEAAPIPAPATPAAASTPAAPPVEAKFNALPFLWAVFKDFIRGLFGRPKAT
jgi:carbon monoxide dehydrogenase subunit G